jgi:hypothetical protein
MKGIHRNAEGIAAFGYDPFEFFPEFVCGLRFFAPCIFPECAITAGPEAVCFDIFNMDTCLVKFPQNGKQPFKIEEGFTPTYMYRAATAPTQKTANFHRLFLPHITGPPCRGATVKAMPTCRRAAIIYHNAAVFKTACF